MSTEFNIDVLFTLDTTGSMRPARHQARQNIKEITSFLFGQVPNLRMGIITHGDYCDGDRLVNILDFTNDEKRVKRFLEDAPDTSGGDSDEAYEYVFNQARKLEWTAGKQKAIVMIADANPHEKGSMSAGHRVTLDWRNELDLLVEAGVKVFPVQALSHYGSATFYKEIAQRSATPHLKLDQFTDVPDLLVATAMQTAGKLDEFEEFLARRGGVSRGTREIVANLAGRAHKVEKGEATRSGLFPVEPSRFQILDVPHDVSIKDFVLDNGLTFNIGRGFYEFKVPVKVQDYKEVIVQDKRTEEMFSGDSARKLLGIPTGSYGTVRVRPDVFQDKYRGFIQSTSANRKLLGDTKFLYEAERF